MKKNRDSWWSMLSFPPLNLYNFPKLDDKILSPCVGKCHLHNDLCTGCKRTSSEINMWSILTEDERYTIMCSLRTRE